MILLGVSGSIAAYKSVELLRLFLKAGQDVRVIMTQAATRFVGPLTFQALSGHPVLADSLDPQGWPPVPVRLDRRPSSINASEGGQMAHLDLPEKASALVLAPATAQLLSQLACGAAGDIVSASILAMPRSPAGRLKAPVLIAPAMHEAMWLHPATRANVITLKKFGYQFIGPERGPLGRADDQGLGRMTDPKAIASIVLKAL